MNFGSTRVTKRILAAELAACAVRSLSTTHDPVAHVSYSRFGVERRVKSGSAAGMMLPVILNALKSQEKERVGEHSGLAKSLALLPRSPSIVFVVSDFINTTEADWEALKRAGRKHRLIAMYVQDRRERELPDVGWLPVLYTVQDAAGVVKDVWVTRRRARRHAEQFKQHEAGVLARLKDCRAKSIVVSTDEGDSAALRVLNQLQAPTL